MRQAVGRAAGWCRDNLGCSGQPHGAKNGKHDQSFVAGGTESHAGDFSQQCEAQRFPPALLPVTATWKNVVAQRKLIYRKMHHYRRKQSSPLRSSSPSAPGAARFPSCRLVTQSRGTHSSPHLSPLKEYSEERELKCSSAFLRSRWAALWIAPAPGSVGCTLHPQAQLHGFPVPLHICKGSAVHREQKSSPEPPKVSAG